MGNAPKSDVVTLRISEGVGYVVLNRPEVMNAVSIELAVRLRESLECAARDETVKVIVLRGAGGNFSVGGDFREVEFLRMQGETALEQLFTAFGDACKLVEFLPIPVLAAVEGYAMAGGFELVLASDITLVRDDAKLSET